MKIYDFMKTTQTIYQTIGPDEEVAITLTRRSWNGIDNDPRVTEQPASIVETAIALELLNKTIHAGFPLRSALSFAQDRETPRNGPSPGLAGGCGASEPRLAPDEGGSGISTVNPIRAERVYQVAEPPVRCEIEGLFKPDFP